MEKIIIWVSENGEAPHITRRWHILRKVFFPAVVCHYLQTHPKNGVYDNPRLMFPQSDNGTW